MTTTLDGVAKKKAGEQSAEQLAAVELIRAAKEQGLSLTGPDGLLEQLTKTVLETSLHEEMTEHLGYEKHDAEGSAGAGTGNIRNGTRPKTPGGIRPAPRHRAGARLTIRFRVSTGQGSTRRRPLQTMPASGYACGPQPKRHLRTVEPPRKHLSVRPSLHP